MSLQNWVLVSIYNARPLGDPQIRFVQTLTKKHMLFGATSVCTQQIETMHSGRVHCLAYL